MCLFVGRRVWGWGAMRYKLMGYMEMDLQGGDPDAQSNLYSYTRSAQHRAAARALALSLSSLEPLSCALSRPRSILSNHFARSALF